MKRLMIWFDEIEKEDVAMVGGKAVVSGKTASCVSGAVHRSFTTGGHADLYLIFLAVVCLVTSAVYNGIISVDSQKLKSSMGILFNWFLNAIDIVVMTRLLDRLLFGWLNSIRKNIKIARFNKMI